MVVHARLHNAFQHTFNLSAAEILQPIVTQNSASLLDAGPAGITAVFNAPYEIPVPNYLAVTCAFEMLAAFQAFKSQTKSKTSLSIGISQGEVYVNEAENTGYTFDRAALTSAINLSERAFSAEIVAPAALFEEVRPLLANDFEIVSAEQLSLDGRSEQTTFYRLGIQPTHIRQRKTLRSVLTAKTSSPQVMIAEDDPNLRALFAKILRRAGFEVIIATNGHDVLQHLERTVPSVIILDIGLPGPSGLDIIRHVRSIDGSRNVNIVVVTGNHLAVQSEESDLADLFLLKPVNTHDLVGFVQRFLK